MDVSDYTCKLGIMYFGGMGGNVKRGLIDAGVTPAQYPDYYAFVGNTDRRVLKRDFGNSEDQKLQPWLDNPALTICRMGESIGGKDITEGRGAGGDPVIGRRAAEAEKTIKEMTAFLKKVDEVFFVGAVGGGTGTGALPVAAKLCKDLGKPTLAFVVMPEPEEGLDEHALPALDEIRSLVTTTAIQNAYLIKLLDSLPPDEKESLTTREVWSVLNEKTLNRWIMVFKEIVQEVGLEEFDEADWKMILSKGKYFYFGLAEVKPEKMRATTSEKIVTDLFSAEFLDQSVAERGEVVGLWFHGRWPDQKVREIRNLVKVKLAATSPVPPEKLQVHKGIYDTPKDEKIWVSMFITANEPRESIASSAQPVSGSAEVETIQESATLLEESAPAVASAANGARYLSEKVPQEELRPVFGAKLPAFSFGRNSRGHGEVSYPHNGEVVHCQGVPVDLVKQFQALTRNPANFSEADANRICDQIVEVTKIPMDVRPRSNQMTVAH